MDDAELLGGVLDSFPDPYGAARELASLLVDSHASRAAAIRTGFDPDLVDVVRGKLAGDQRRIAMACSLGASWVMGRRSIGVNEPWELVASLPAGSPLPPGLRRTTGETLMRLVVEARRTVRLLSPFMDRSGLVFLADALAAATQRGVLVEVLLPTRSTHADEALEDLKQTIDRHGARPQFGGFQPAARRAMGAPEGPRG